MKRRMINGYDRYAYRNLPWDEVQGSQFRIRIWQNDLGQGRFELKADIVHNRSGGATPSMHEAELREIHEIVGRALKKMRRHGVRQAWKHVLFPWR